MSRAVLSIGSNLGDDHRAPADMLASAVDVLSPWLVAASPVYRTAPWGPVPQQDYLNAVLIVDDPEADPDVWLARAHVAEAAAGRTREVRWGPRTLDVDVVAVDDVVSSDPALELPHPRARDRAFVLVPWLAVDPHARLGGRPVAELVAALPDEDVAAVRRCPELRLRPTTAHRGWSR